MIDIHCHILPGLDDGAKHMEESLSMARAAINEGIHTIIATPHHKNGSYENDREAIIKEVAYLNESLAYENIPLTILPGQEIRIHGEMINGIQTGELMTLNESTRYAFVELPTNHIPRYTTQLLFDLQVHDLIPIIVHPERNTELLEHPNRLYEFVRNGALTQVTAASTIGKFGKKTMKFSHELIEYNLTHFIASDAHNLRSRSFMMAAAINQLEAKFGQQTVYKLLDNAELLVDGQTVFAEEPQRIERKKFFGLF
ncbi:protein-tyrosine phosphatase [Amphibacillus marinus]|uniref:Tyrosine-protein phosphatase n=1 Tax=Amphibacillus marinus TaxID=872970 RepID=A0A1H8N641_9BACI|nr:CpsB/CapC family capsule biosynthesis tyrosine phosphatase [Amphibacillus marinus]SEO25075.1 protein-tyrosine phosphatase [Amphibacillus marinus]